MPAHLTGTLLTVQIQLRVQPAAVTEGKQLQICDLVIALAWHFNGLCGDSHSHTEVQFAVLLVDKPGFITQAAVNMHITERLSECPVPTRDRRTWFRVGLL